MLQVLMQFKGIQLFRILLLIKIATEIPMFVLVPGLVKDTGTEVE